MMNELAFSEEAFFFEQSLDLLSVISLDGYFRRINPLFVETLGYSEAELLSRPLLEFVHPDDHAPTLVEMEKLSTGIPTLYFENRYRTKAGDYRWLEWNASPQLDRGIVCCIARDITRQKQTEQERQALETALQKANQELEQHVAERTAQLEQANAALRESEERNQRAMEVARMFSFEWEPRTDAVKRSPHCGSILSLAALEAEQDTGSNFFQRIHPDDRDHFVSNLQTLTPENNTYKITYRVLRPDGQTVILEESGRAIFDSQGQLTRLIGMTADITERQRLEAELQESQATLQRQLAEIETIYQSAPIGLNVLDTDLRFVRINQQLAEINGISVEAHIGRTVRELLPEIADMAEAILRPILETGEPRLNVEIIGETPAQPGVQRVWLESFLPLKDGDRIIGISTVCEEITERKRTEEALRQSEERYRLLFETMEDGFCVIEVLFDQQSNPIDYRFLEMNPTFERQTGLQNALGKTAYQLLPNLDLFWVETYGRVALTGESARFENISRVTDRWFEVYAFSIGKPGSHKVAVLFKDISDRKRSEIALKENEDRLRMAIASAQLGTWDWNLVTNELKWDAGCKAMFGLPPDAEITIEVFFAALHPEDRDRLQAIIQGSLDPTSGGSYDTEYRIIGQDHAERWLRSKGQVYYDAHGNPLRFSGTVLEITGQKQAEAQREQLLQQEQAAREAAERANRMKDEFLAILSHELRTPLNPILGWAQLLQSANIKPDRLQQGLSTIERNAKHQAQLIEDLLDISRITRGQLTLNFAVIHLSGPIMAALETIRLAAEAKSIRLEVFLDPSMGPTCGDAGRLQQVVWNLLSNAIKFTPPGGQVTVRLERVIGSCELANASVPAAVSSAIPHYAQITVTDTGSGIQSDFLPHVFELFQQQDSSTTRSFGGLGLGLAIVRQVVEAHGGTITASSAGKGRGATFTVLLPLISASNSEVPAHLPDQLPNFANLQVVVVDDDADSLEVIKVLLEQEGTVVRAVLSAREALQVLSKDTFDVLISDIGMPEMDGYTFIQEVRRLSPQLNRNIPAIALTAYAGDTNQRKILAAGFQAHLAKPVEPSLLLEAIATVTVP